MDPVPDPVGSELFCRIRIVIQGLPIRTWIQYPDLFSFKLNLKEKLNFSRKFQNAVQNNCKIMVGANSNDNKKCGILYLLFFYGPACSGINRH